MRLQNNKQTINKQQKTIKEETYKYTNNIKHKQTNKQKMKQPSILSNEIHTNFESLRKLQILHYSII